MYNKLGKMNVYVCVFLGLAVFQVDSKALNNEGVEDRCVEELELDEKEVRSTVQKPDTPEDHEMYGNFYVCVWKGRGVMHENATINSEALEDFLGEMFPKSSTQSKDEQDEIISMIVERCENVQGDTEQQTGIKLKNCMVVVVNEIVNGKVSEEDEEDKE